MRNVSPLELLRLLALLALPLGHAGCFWLVAGGAAEGGYVAGQDKSAGDTVSDQWIHTKVRSALLADGRVASRNINVDVDKGVVKLKGVVSSQTEKDAAVATARKVQGVKKVLDALYISP